MTREATRGDVVKGLRQLPSLVECFGEQLPQVKIVDVGALWLGEEPYDALVKAGLARVVGFEPVAAECEALNLRFRLHGLYLPYAIGDGTERRFHRCTYSMTSSLYEPDLEYMGLYHNLPDFCEPQDVWNVQTVRLDDIREADHADYLKIDVQGAELDVLRGAENALQTVLVVHTEVEFVPIYRGQPCSLKLTSFYARVGSRFTVLRIWKEES
ncbi:MAG TPA: FkbM family methyltransferase [Bryobacteraceae bacterium]|nr:FkbM family methyltransferase [Bryobacteraceae bacterium]